MQQIFMRKRIWGAARVRAEEVPAPALLPGTVVVATQHSLISAGTELTAVGSTKRDMIAKALKTPSIRDGVREMLANNGLQKTLARVHYELNKWTALGYSGAGIAVEVGAQVGGIQPGTLVAYGGQPHAEYVRVPKNLCVPVPAGVTSEEAAFVALGSIALHAVRRANVQVGDTVAVLGLGLVGQLVAQLLKLAGARVIGTDVLDARLELARRNGCDHTLKAGAGVVNEVHHLTSGLGADRVLICAAASGRQLMEQAAALARDKARLVVVGQVELDLPRHIFYMKELDLVLSRSYGPGRYDRQYEEHGHDYPAGYVRWTERRNMEEFLRLVQEHRINVRSLITHQFEVDEAEKAYQLLRQCPETALGVLLRYPASAEVPSRTVILKPIPRRTVSGCGGRVAVIGCGSFARQFYLPLLRSDRQLQFKLLVATTGQSAAEMGRWYGAERAATDVDVIWNDPEIDAVMIFTRDNTHAQLTEKALQCGKHVFCEKPLATTARECARLLALAAAKELVCMTGFNRRFAPMIQTVRKILKDSSGPKLICYRVNAGSLSPETWVKDPVHATGRIVGEACHFVDLCRYLTNAEPRRVTATSIGPCHAEHCIEDVAVLIEFDDGSVANLLYTAIGSPATGKERIEIYCQGTTILLDNFNILTIRGRQRIDWRHRVQDKGHAGTFRHWRNVLLGQSPCELTAYDGIIATGVCLAILQSARSGTPVDVADFVQNSSDDYPGHQQRP